MIELLRGDCLEVMRGMPDASYTACLCDPPYGLRFMGKAWDHGVPGVSYWAEALRVLKPGAVLMAFGGTRTFHRLACAIEDAGFEIADTIMWVYGSGFPKSHDISKAIDKAAGAEREVIGSYQGASNIGKKGDGKFGYSPGNGTNAGGDLHVDVTAPATSDAATWDGWGTALKPSFEPVIVARKPRAGLTYAQCAVRYGSGALWIDGGRVETGDNLNGGGYSGGTPKTIFNGLGRLQPEQFIQPLGRWPANLIHDGSDEATAGMADAARYFYCAKASRAERDAGLEGWEAQVLSVWGGEEDDLSDGKKAVKPSRNNHPTVKPLALTEYLAKLLRPPEAYLDDAALLVPFAGVGSEMIGAVRAGWRNVTGIELSAEYAELGRARLAYWQEQTAPQLELALP